MPFESEILSGERLLKLRRQRGVDETSAESFPVIWCIAAKQYIAVCGCADGSVEVACLERNKLIGVYQQSRIGIVHVLYVGSRVVVARLDGSIEFLELSLTTERPTRVKSIMVLNVIRAHQKPISYLGASSLTAVSASYDHTLKVFDLRTCQLQSMLHAHSGPVTAVCIDHSTSILFSACEQGIICWWNLTTGELLRSLDVKCTGKVQLACTTDYLLGYTSEGDFILWNKSDGNLLSRIAQHHIKKDAVLIARGLVALGDEMAVTSSEFTLTFWDLEHKAIIRQVILTSYVTVNVQID
ncbi:WD domain, G-beta repeat protein [Ostertagia ostertagi]